MRYLNLDLTQVPVTTFVGFAVGLYLEVSHNMRMKVCLFDIDGTLINSGGAGKAAMEAALRSAFGFSEVFDGVPFSGRTDRAIGRDLFRIHGLQDDPHSWQQFVAAYLGHLPSCLSSHPGRVLPGVLDLLDRLSRQGVVLGLLTGNFREGARLKLAHFDLFGHFKFGGFGDYHLERDDVAREALVAIEGYLQGPPFLERLVVIGDTPLDVRCARAIGARVVAVASGWHSRDELAATSPDLLLTDLTEITALESLWN
jgi:phosphoglycolate phosphatase-like HAD superfamily hydrolase